MAELFFCLESNKNFYHNSSIPGEIEAISENFMAELFFSDNDNNNIIIIIIIIILLLLIIIIIIDIVLILIIIIHY